jgi:HEAT repeat protein
VQELQEEVSVRFSRLPLRQALEKLLARVNYLVLLEGPGPQEGTRPALVWVFGRRESSPPQESARAEGGRPENEPAAEDEEERLRSLHALAAEGNEGALRRALSDPSPAIQAMALNLLAEKKGQEAIPLLVAGTTSNHPQMRLRALDLLNVSQADEQTVLSALGSVVADKDKGVKSYAIRALAARGGPTAVQHLRHALRDSDAEVRIVVIDNIVRSQSIPPAEKVSLLQEAAGDSSEMVRSAASAWLEESIPER